MLLNFYNKQLSACFPYWKSEGFRRNQIISQIMDWGHEFFLKMQLTRFDKSAHYLQICGEAGNAKNTGQSSDTVQGVLTKG